MLNLRRLQTFSFASMRAQIWQVNSHGCMKQFLFIAKCLLFWKAINDCFVCRSQAVIALTLFSYLCLGLVSLQRANFRQVSSVIELWFDFDRRVIWVFQLSSGDRFWAELCLLTCWEIKFIEYKETVSACCFLLSAFSIETSVKEIIQLLLDEVDHD